MADSTRKKIRDAVKTVVTTAGTFGANVYIGRRDAIPENKLPAACIYLGEENIELASMNPRTYRVEQNVRVDAYVKKTGATGVEELMDIARDAVMDAVMEDHTLDGAVLDTNPTGSTPQVDEESGVSLGAIAIDFEVLYFEER